MRNVADVITRATRWLTADADAYYAEVADPHAALLVTKARLAGFDSRLPLVLDHLFSIAPSGEKPVVAGELLALTLFHWNNTPPSFVTVEGNTCYVKQVHSLALAASGDMINTCVDRYHLDSTKQGLAFASSCERVSPTLPLDWLEHHYPGSKTRLQAAVAMAATPEELAVYTCSPQAPALPVELPDDLSE